MNRPPEAPSEFSKREREIMDVIYRVGEGTATEVARDMPATVSFDSIRVTLGILERKGHLTHRRDGRRNVYRSVVSRDAAKQSAMSRILETFFAGSSSTAILTLLEMSGDGMTEDEIEEIAERLEAMDKDGSTGA